jgi:hypothetical protein
MKVKFIER